jgi:hypothetical protein
MNELIKEITELKELNNEFKETYEIETDEIKGTLELMEKSQKGVFNFLGLLRKGNKELVEKLIELLSMMLYLPASTRHHGSYRGGLYDHTTLVFYFSALIYKRIGHKQPYKFTELGIISLVHDLEKIWSRRKQVPNEIIPKNFRITTIDERKAGKEIRIRLRKYKGRRYTGQCYHVDKTYALLKKMKIKINDKQLFALTFHHGGWSNYKYRNKPDSDEMAGTLHASDMIVSQSLNI